ncbi:hypothetical protein PMAYCL1PPCAC_30334, partial [Pristionchus mayeri]
TLLGEYSLVKSHVEATARFENHLGHRPVSREGLRCLHGVPTEEPRQHCFLLGQRKFLADAIPWSSTEGNVGIRMTSCHLLGQEMIRVVLLAPFPYFGISVSDDRREDDCHVPGKIETFNHCVMGENSSKERNGGHQPQCFFYTSLEINESSQISFSRVPVNIAIEHRVDFIVNTFLEIRVLSEEPESESHSGSRRVVAFEHESVDFLSDIFI